jgi:hypothetical protein
MWVGIALFLLLLIDYPSNPNNVFLIAIPLVAGGLIVTFRDKNRADKAWLWVIVFWKILNILIRKILNIPIPGKNTDKKPKDKQKQ